MEETQVKILDDSGDKKYFSQLPHYILNHSTAIDQALYWQMKRYSGESGKCFATQETLMKKLGIGRKAYNKSLQYLLSRKWIKYIGMTPGKTRPIKTYAITDIWKLNILNYEKIPAERTVSSKKIPAERTGDTGQKNSKIQARRTVEEELTKEEHINNIYSDDFISFYIAYPVHKAKVTAYKAWTRSKTKPSLKVLLAAIEEQKKSRAWKEGFIPHPATWLNQGRWEDEIEKESAVQGFSDEEKNMVGSLTDWNSRQPMPIEDFNAEGIVRKHGSEKVGRLMREMGEYNNGFSMFLKSLNK